MLIPKHNFATLTCVRKTVHTATTIVYLGGLYFGFFSGQIGLSFGGKMVVDIFFFYYQRKTAQNRYLLIFLLLSKENWTKI
ncbi:unnamed protein product, partial [Staurois parvus]